MGVEKFIDLPGYRFNDILLYLEHTRMPFHATSDEIRGTSGPRETFSPVIQIPPQSYLNKNSKWFKNALVINQNQWQEKIGFHLIQSPILFSTVSLSLGSIFNK